MGKWYVVWVGTEPGICDSWEECELRVKGYEGARYKAFNTKAAAIEAFREGDSDMGILRAIAMAPKKVVNYSAIPEIVKDSIAVDAACSGNPGVMEYRGVDVLTGAELFHSKQYPEGTNNIGEFLALVHALALFDKQGNCTTSIYSDSITAQAWVRDRMCRSKLQPTAQNAELLAVVRRAEFWLQTHTPKNRILKWDTKKWGEIPADFGRK